MALRQVGDEPRRGSSASERTRRRDVSGRWRRMASEEDHETRQGTLAASASRGRRHALARVRGLLYPISTTVYTVRHGSILREM